MLNGPMIACFVVYDEFQHYKSGRLYLLAGELEYFLEKYFSFFEMRI
jgi:hypothetical protein